MRLDNGSDKHRHVIALETKIHQLHSAIIEEKLRNRPEITLLQNQVFDDFLCSLSIWRYFRMISTWNVERSECFAFRWVTKGSFNAASIKSQRDDVIITRINRHGNNARIDSLAIYFQFAYLMNCFLIANQPFLNERSINILGEKVVKWIGFHCRPWYFCKPLSNKVASRVFPSCRGHQANKCLANRFCHSFWSVNHRSHVIKWFACCARRKQRRSITYFWQVKSRFLTLDKGLRDEAKIKDDEILISTWNLIKFMKCFEAC